MAAPTDLDLLDAFRHRQDQQAFAALVERHAAWVYALCLRATGRASEAEEASSGAFFELARCTHRVRERLPAWLHTVARRQAARVIARRPDTVALSADLAAQQQHHADVEHLDEALDELDDELRSVLVLRFLAGCSQELIAQRLRLSQPTVSRRLAEALARMRAALDRRGVVAGVVPAELFRRLPAADLPGRAQQLLRRAALVARPAAPSAGGASLMMAALLVTALAAAVALAWIVLRTPAARPPVPVSIAVDQPLAAPPQAQAPSAALLGWTARICWVSAADAPFRRTLGAARTITAFMDRPIALIGWSADERWQSADPELTVLDADGQPRRLLHPPVDHLDEYLCWSPCDGISHGGWDAAVASAAALWRAHPEQALAALDRAAAAGCPRSQLGVFGAAVASEADRPDLVAAWSAQVPADRQDRWMADAALYRVLRAHGSFSLARKPLERLSASFGRLPPDLADVAAAPAWPTSWRPVRVLGGEMSTGSAHIWDGNDARLQSPPIAGPIAIEVRGDCFTATPGLARKPSGSGIFLEPVYDDGHAPGLPEMVGVAGVVEVTKNVLDGSGVLIPWLPAIARGIDVRILVDGKTCAVWSDGRLRALAPQRHQGRWRVVVMASACDLYLPRFVVSTPQAPLQDDLLGAIIADDADAVRRRLRLGDDPTAQTPGSSENPLCVAASGDRTHAIAALLEDARVHLDSPDSGGGTALYRAVDNHAVAAARFLLEHGAPVSPLNRWGTSPLGYACRSRQPDLADLLLSHGARTEEERTSPGPAQAALDLLAPGDGADELIAVFRRHGIALTARALAISGDSDGAIAALQDQARRDREGQALLAAAVLLDDRALVRRCLKARVPVDARDPETGMTALQLAVGTTGNPDIAADLCSQGASLDAPGKDGSARQLAARSGFPLDQLRPSAAASHSGF